MSDPQDTELGRWMSKAELAAVRGIAVGSAERLIRRQRWRRMLGNDGRIRALIPPDWAEPHGKNPPDEACNRGAASR
jgi:hypothetical protein